MSILVSKQCLLHIAEVQRDPQGRYLFLKGTLHKRPITTVNVYAPNTQVTFFRKTLQLLMFHSGTLIVGGDFNVAMNPSIDTSKGLSSLTYRALHAIRSQFSNMLLHDTWRTLHPKDKDFTFFLRLINTRDLTTSVFPKATYPTSLKQLLSR